MTSSIPDSMSTEALLELMASAVDDTEDTSKSEDKPSMTESEMKDLVRTTIEELTDKFDSIFGYKLVAMYCITALKVHHDNAALKIMEDGDFQLHLLGHVTLVSVNLPGVMYKKSTVAMRTSSLMMTTD